MGILDHAMDAQKENIPRHLFQRNPKAELTKYYTNFIWISKAPSRDLLWDTDMC